MSPPSGTESACDPKNHTQVDLGDGPLRIHAHPTDMITLTPDAEELAGMRATRVTRSTTNLEAESLPVSERQRSETDQESQTYPVYVIDELDEELLFDGTLTLKLKAEALSDQKALDTWLADHGLQIVRQLAGSLIVKTVLDQPEDPLTTAVRLAELADVTQCQPNLLIEQVRFNEPR